MVDYQASWKISAHIVPPSATPGLADEVIPGFKVKLNWAPRFWMKPEDAYRCAIGYMYDLASAGWDEIIPKGDDRTSKEVESIRIALASVAKPRDRNQLQNKHVILGILKMLNNMAKWNQFCLTTADMSLYAKGIGQMAIGSRDFGELAGGDYANFTLNEKNSTRNATESRSLTEGGRIVDPEDTNFVISYTLRGEPISCQALFDAALNGMAHSAEMDDHDHCVNFAGFSSSAKVLYMINSGPAETTREVLSYMQVRTTLKLLPEKLYEGGRCGEVDFVLIYGGEQLGGGFIHLSDFEKSNRVAVTS